MAKTYEFESVRKIGKIATYSYHVTLPKDVIQALGWQNRQRVVVAKQGDTIVIRDWKKGKKG